jgi:hypothetical protein
MRGRHSHLFTLPHVVSRQYHGGAVEEPADEAGARFSASLLSP